MGSIFDDMEITNKTSVLKELDDELMTKASSNDGTSIVSIDDLVEFDNHPFVVDTESNEFEELVDSIKENGLIYPILVRPMEDKYEIISGHRRVAACRAAGIEELPAIVRELDDFEATVFMVHSNFARNEISIMERAKAYRMCHDVEKHQGKKNDSGDTAEKIGSEVSDSRRKVYRYIRLSYLNDNLLKKVSDKEISINAGIDLSYLDPEESQVVLWNFMDENDLLPTPAQAAELKKLHDNEELPVTREKLMTIFFDEPKKKAAKTSLSFKKKDLEEYFDPDTELEKMEQIIIQLLTKYKEGAISEFED